jgi:hypothetical protein
LVPLQRNTADDTIDTACYYHALFLRGRPDLCQSMVRTKIKGKSGRVGSSSATESTIFFHPHCNDTNESSVSQKDCSMEPDATSTIGLPNPVTPPKQRSRLITLPDRDEINSSLMVPPPPFHGISKNVPEADAGTINLHHDLIAPQSSNVMYNVEQKRKRLQFESLQQYPMLFPQDHVPSSAQASKLSMIDAAISNIASCQDTLIARILEMEKMRESMKKQKLVELYYSSQRLPILADNEEEPLEITSIPNEPLRADDFAGRTFHAVPYLCEDDLVSL